MATPSPADLTREKTLFALYRLGQKFPHSKFNLTITVLTVLGLSLYCYGMWGKPEVLMSIFRKLAELGLGFAASILGFLIAGFTIFVTVTKWTFLLGWRSASTKQPAKVISSTT